MADVEQHRRRLLGEGLGKPGAMAVIEIGAAVVGQAEPQQPLGRDRRGELDARPVLGNPPLRQDVELPALDLERAAFEEVLPVHGEALLGDCEPGRRKLGCDPVEGRRRARRAVAMDAEKFVARDVGHQPVTVERIGGLCRRDRHGEPREKDGNGMAQHRATVA